MRFFKEKSVEKHRLTGEEYHRRRERKQWDAQNRIAVVSNYITGIGVFFSVIAAFGAVAAAIYAHGAYVQAKIQSTAAKSSADAAWASANAASEPFLSLVFTGAAKIKIFIDDGETVPVGITITNYGDAPAIIDGVECSSAWGTSQGVNFNLINGPIENGVIAFGRGRVLTKGDPVSADCDGIWPENHGTVGLPKKANDDQVREVMIEHPLWLLARISYHDILGRRHQSDFCSEFEYNGADFGDAAAFDVSQADECKNPDDE